MEQLAQGLLRRELGFNRFLGLNVKKQLTELTWKEEDRIVISPKNPIYSMEFCPISTQPKILALSDEIGGVTLVDTQTKSNQKIVSHFQCHSSSLYTVTWAIPRPHLLATGASDQTVCIWDANSFQKLATFTGHSKTVRRVRFHPTRSDMVASGGRDGAILLWDLRVGSTVIPENEIYAAHNRVTFGNFMSHDKKGRHLYLLRRQKKSITPTPVTDFLFANDNTLVSCGATDGQIKFWDIRKTYKYLDKIEPVRHLDYDVANCKGYSSICIDAYGNLYASTAMDDIVRFRIFDDSKLPDRIYKRPRSDYSVSIDLSSDGRYLISGSVTPFACIWDTWDKSTELPFVQLEGTLKDYYSSPCALFCPNDPMRVVTGADDSNLTIWRFMADRNSGVPSYKSNTIEAFPLAPFTFIEHFKQPRLIPKQKKIQVSKEVYLDDLPSFVVDGRLPHLSEIGRKPCSKIHTWLANFSKPSVVPVKKHIKLKRKVLPLSSTESPTVKSISYNVPKKRRRRISRALSRKKTNAVRGSGENEVRETINSPDSPSILKYFSPVTIPSTSTGVPLRDIDNSPILE